MTRVIRPLRLLGLQREAWAFRDALLLVAENSHINTSTVQRWNNAADWPLHVVPGTDLEYPDTSQGEQWLRQIAQDDGWVLDDEADSLEGEEEGKAEQSLRNWQQMLSQRNKRMLTQTSRWIPPQRRLEMILLNRGILMKIGRHLRQRTFE